MSEEKEQGGNSIKNIVIGLVSTVTLGVGGYITNKLTGADEEEDKKEVQAPAPAPVINITNTNQQKQQANNIGGDKTIIIKEKAVPTDEPKTIKEKKKDEEETW